MEESDKIYADTAMLAGEILLISGAEIFRIEETIRYIMLEIRCKTETMVFSTGIFINLIDEKGESHTVIRRINERSTNLNRICMVNQVSRQLSGGILSIQDAYQKLTQIKVIKQYTVVSKGLSYISIAFFFSVLLGGSVASCLASAFAGGIVGAVVCISGVIGVKDFWINALGAFFGGLAALFLKHSYLYFINENIVIISAIMPLVPGVIFTTAVRDTLYGDYSSGIARMVEAVVIALAVAGGVGIAMSLFQYMMEKVV